jgi:hypothetical protein
MRSSVSNEIVSRFTVFLFSLLALTAVFAAATVSTDNVFEAARLAAACPHLR